MADPTLTGIEALRTIFRPLLEIEQNKQDIIAANTARKQSVQDQKRLIDARKAMLEREYELRKDMAKEAKDLQKELNTEAQENLKRLTEWKSERDDATWFDKSKKHIENFLKSQGRSLDDFDPSDPKSLASLRTETESYLEDTVRDANTTLWKEAFTPVFSIWLKRLYDSIANHAVTMTSGMTPGGKSELYRLMQDEHAATDTDTKLDDEIALAIRSERKDATDEEINAILNKLHTGKWAAYPDHNQRAAGWLDIGGNPTGEGQMGAAAGEILFQKYKDTFRNTVYGMGGVGGSKDMDGTINPMLQQLAPTLYEELTAQEDGPNYAAGMAMRTNSEVLATLLDTLSKGNPFAFAAVLEEVPALAREVRNPSGGLPPGGFRGLGRVEGSGKDRPNKGEGLSDTPSRSESFGKAGEQFYKDVGLGVAAPVGGMLGSGIGRALDYGKAAADTAGKIGNKALGISQGVVGAVQNPDEFFGKMIFGEDYADTLVPEIPKTPATPPVAPTTPLDDPASFPMSPEEGAPAPIFDPSLSGMPSVSAPNFRDKVRQLNDLLS